MSWYRAGTVTVTNGSAVVTGTGTDFVANAAVGDAFLGPDGRTYEVASVQTATQLTLVKVYLGGTAGGQAYSLQPTQSFARDLALSAAALLNGFGAVRDGIGQGLIADGTIAAPGIRFAADQDTGLRRYGTNALAFVSGGQDALIVTGNRHIGVGTPPTVLSDALRTIHLYGDTGSIVLLGGAGGVLGQALVDNSTMVVGSRTAHPLILTTQAAERARIDASGNLFVGFAGGPNCHVVGKAGAEGSLNTIFYGTGVNREIVQIFNVAASGFNGASSAFMIAKNSATGRSINSGGTINATGADYAEYMTKADGCGTIAKGDVCGVDVDGRLTKTWADAVSFVVKSTDPSYVGGDTWSAHLPPRPEATSPLAPEPVRGDDEEAAAFADRHNAWVADRDRFDAEQPAHEQALAKWNAQLEAARETVDRIAFAGQVPVTVSGDFAVGDYLIAAANGGGIKAVAVPAVAITFDQYRLRLGKVWAVRDGRAWMDVQHG